MAIVQRIPPAGGLQAISQALAQRMPRSEFLSPLGGAPATGAPLPIYNIELDQTTQPDPVDAATLVGWSYPVVGGPTPGLARLSTEDAGNQYEGLTRGYLPERLLEAAQVAEQEVGLSNEAYEPRILQIPALRIAALWMYGAHDRFILMTDGQTPQPDGPPPVVDDIKPVIEAARGPGAPDTHPEGAGPSN